MRLNVMSNELVKNNAECLHMVRAVIEILSPIMRFRPSAHLSNPLARPRLPNGILLAIGGWSGTDPTNSIESYDVSTDLWMQVTDQDVGPRAYHGTAVLNGSIYCVGGFNRVEHFNSVRRFDVSMRTWHEAAPMNHRRCYVSVAVLGECIYAMGGLDGHSRLSTAERYRPETNQWSLLAPMHEHRSDGSSTTLHNKVGGFDGSVRLSSAEVYNPGSNTWQQVSHMLTSRSNFGIEVLNDRLYVVAYNGHGICSNIEYYDAATEEWTWTEARYPQCCELLSGLPNMAEYILPRDSLAVVSLDDVSGDSSEHS